MTDESKPFNIERPKPFFTGTIFIQSDEEPTTPTPTDDESDD